MESELIKFYKGSGTDQSGRKISDIWNFNHSQLEYNHDFIQWLFPLPERSRFNYSAPVLTKQDIDGFKNDPVLRANVFRSFETMMKFYGFEINRADNNYSLIKSAAFKERSANWLNPGNHNFLRITRILKFLTLAGQAKLATCFFTALDEVYATNKPVISSSYNFWKSAVQ